MVQIVFTSPYQDEVDVSDVGLNFKRDQPQTVTEEQAKVLLTHAFFKSVPIGNAPIIKPTIPAPAAAPEEPAS